MSPTHKTCPACGLEKPVAEFYIRRHINGRVGLASLCKICGGKAVAKWRIENRQKFNARNRERRRASLKYHAGHRERFFKWKYGITSESIETMRKVQNYCCASCGVHENTLDRKLCVDHNHKTGRIRALLCNACNTAEGQLKTSDKARALADYMDYHSILDILASIV